MQSDVPSVATLTSTTRGMGVSPMLATPSRDTAAIAARDTANPIASISAFGGSHVSAELTADPHTTTRLTLAPSSGGGDPLLYPHLERFVTEATARHIPLAIETDLLNVSPDRITFLAQSNLDLLLVHLPAATRQTYATVMGADALDEVLSNLKLFLTSRKHSTPLVIPIFTKLKQNVAEMEAWYDHWLRTLGTAIIEGSPLPEHAVSDMSPPQRIPCRRLQNRMQLLSDGTLAQCEFDTSGYGASTSISTIPLADLWRTALHPLRQQHSTLALNVLPPLCTTCKEWDRP